MSLVQGPLIRLILTVAHLNPINNYVIPISVSFSIFFSICFSIISIYPYIPLYTPIYPYIPIESVTCRGLRDLIPIHPPPEVYQVAPWGLGFRGLGFRVQGLGV